MEEELNNVVEETTDNIESDGADTVEVVEVEESTESEQEETQEEFTDTSETEVGEQTKQSVKTFTEDEVKNIIAKRVAREQRKYENTYKPLVNTLKAGGFDTDNPTEIAEKLRHSYEEQGVTIPDYKNTLTEREQKALAKADAEEIIELGEDVMRETFTELYQKVSRTPREEQLMRLIGIENSRCIAKQKAVELGGNSSIVEDPKFIKFSQRYADNIAFEEIYKDYQDKYGQKTEKPASAGSVKSNSVETKNDYNTMSKKDFEKEIERALNG